MVSQPLPRPLAALVAALALLLPLSVVSGATGAPAEPYPVVSASAAATAPVVDAESTVTLITGDRVMIEPRAGDEPVVTMVDASGAPLDGGYSVNRGEDGIWVIPHSVVGLVPEVLDVDLFNVTLLADLGYDDASSEVLPLIVQTMPGTGLASSSPLTSEVALTSIDAVAAQISKDDAAGLGAELTGLTANSTQAVRAALGGGTKVWLDGKVEVAALDGYLEQVNAPVAWDLELDGSGVTVAVLDTGVDADHPALAGQVVNEMNFTDAPDAVDRQGHGTHVASLLAGTGAGSDGARQGIAPAAEVLSAKVLDDEGFGQHSWVIAGMEWAVAEGADIANLSLAGETSGEDDPVVLALEALADESDTLFVAAAGNFGSAVHGHYTIGTPGTAPSALTIGAVREDDILASFSSWGPTWGTERLKPDMVAPGVDLMGALAGARDGDLYIPMSGTSMASPVVAGAAALLRQQHPEWSAEQVKARLMTTSDPNGWFTAWTHGAGRLDLAAATGLELSSDHANLDFGYIYYPDEDDRHATVTLTNQGTEDVEVDLSVGLAGDLGDVAPEGSISVDPATATVPAGGSTEVEVVVHLQELDHGPWQGVLAAASEGTDLLRIPIGLYFEPPTYQVDFQILDRNGDPWDPAAGQGVPGADPTIPIFNGLTGTSIRLHPDADGRATARLAVGEWMALARVYTPGADGQPGTITVAGVAAFDVDEDMTHVLDARDAELLTPASVAGTNTRPQQGVSLVYERTGAGRAYFEAVGLDADMVASGQVFLAPTEPVQTGGFQAVVRWWLEPTEAGRDPNPDAFDLVVTDDVFGEALAPSLSAAEVAALARVEQRFHPIGEAGSYEVVTVANPHQVHARLGVFTEAVAPGSREVMTFTGADADWEQCLIVPANDYLAQWGAARSLDEGEELTRVFGATMHPQVHEARQSAGSLYAVVGVTDGLHIGTLRPDNVQESTLHLETAEGESVGSADGLYAHFPTGDLSGRFRLSHDVTMTPGVLSGLSSAHTVWEFDSEPPPPGGDFGVDPTLLGVNYGFDLDPSGQVRTNQPLLMEVEILPTTVDVANRIETFELEWSTDDGSTWHDLRAHRVDDHTFQTRLPDTALRGADTLSFRVAATDAAGSSIEQTTQGLVPVAPSPGVSGR